MSVKWQTSWRSSFRGESVFPRTIAARTILAALAGIAAMTFIASGATVAVVGSLMDAIPFILTIKGAAIVSAALVLLALRSTLAPLDELQGALEYYRDHGVQDAVPGNGGRSDLMGLVDAMLGRVQVDLTQSLAAAETDPLTGLLNRRGFDRLCKEAASGSVIFVDLDDFKRVNDALGHDAGDRVLTEVAKLLRSVLRQDEILLRYGGEEFVVFLPDSDLKGARLVAERIRRTAQYKLRTEVGVVTISAGVAELRPGERLPSALSRADRAAYRAKEDGRNCVRVDKGTALGKAPHMCPATAAE